LLTLIDQNLKIQNFADFKLLVAAGISNEGYTTTSEIIELEYSSETWNDLKPLSTMMDTPMAGYLNSSIPLICGI
jgi:hypothetical protein